MRKYADQVSLLNDIAEQWYESHRKKGRVNTNVMTAGIAVAELLKRNYPPYNRECQYQKRQPS